MPTKITVETHWERSVKIFLPGAKKRKKEKKKNPKNPKNTIC